MRLATWNVNSLKARLERVEEWSQIAAPDIVCLQETKLADAAFPALAFHALGYEAVHHGQGRWNGVAILSRVGIEDVTFGFADGGPADAEARLLTATCGALRVTTVYVPNGRAVGHEQYHHKLRWLARLGDHVEASRRPGTGTIVCGDFNVAADDRDVWDPSACHGGTHVSPPERSALGALCHGTLVDVFRQRFAQDSLFSWWDYRAGMFHKHMGMRIDLVLADPSLASRLSWALIDRNARKGQAPSDHAPVVVQFEDEPA